MGKIYVVEKGKNPGIYHTWNECQSQIKGFSGAKFKSYTNIEEANNALKNGIIYKNAKNINNKKINSRVLLPSICVDGACSGNPGIGEYQCVNVETNEVIFSSNAFQDTTNNLMEFFALIEALQYIQKNNLNIPIYSDSKSAISWVRNKKVKSSLKPSKNNKDSLFLVKKYSEWLNNMDNFDFLDNIKILKWNTSSWGEIPADFGRK